jgi:HD-GYP domain-containing protein (c-di-GMP phosphodiesterase class II)
MSNPPPALPEVTDSTLPLMMPDTWPGHLRNFIARHLEFVFVIFIAATVTGVFYLFPYKIAFLNFFYLPVLAAGYFMGKRRAVLGATACILLAVFFGIRHPEWFGVQGTLLNSLLLIATWGGFLILTSAGIGSLQERLARGFEETRQLLEELKRTRVIEEMKEKVEKTLYSTMDPTVARLATQGKLRFEKRALSIMFTDLTNFTTYSDQNRPDVVLEELNGFLGQIEPIIEVYRGHIDKYMGDGVMIEFGAPIDYDRHALMAVVAGLKMQQKVASLRLPWRLRVGIATGSAIVGMLGVRRQAYSAIGDRVNVAKRLEEICEPGCVYIDEETFQAVEPFIVVNKLRNIGYSRQADKAVVERLNRLEEKLEKEGESAELFHELGKAYFLLHDASAAINYFEKALKLDPESTAIKLSYADANIKKDDYEKIQLKGKLQKVNVYEVVKIKDRWSNTAAIPKSLSEKYQEMEAQIEVPEELVTPIEALDGSIGHSKVVALLSYAVADYMKLNEELKKAILQAGYLQDIGKEAVPHHILNRAGSLTEQEIKLLEKYVQESVAAMRRLGYVDRKLVEIVNHHHESYNGNGFPDGLAADAIPIGARITAVAEAYSALTSWRPYHEPWDMRVAMSELRKGAEKGRYDPKVVDAVIAVLKEGS